MLMNALPPRKLTVDEFLPWAEAQPREAGKFELLDRGAIVQQSQRWAQSRTKHNLVILLDEAIKRAALLYFAAPEGPSLRINTRKVFEPNALVAQLPESALDSLDIPNPILAVEVLSPSTAQVDVTAKLKGYFEVPGIRGYLIVDPERQSHRETLSHR